MICFKIVWRDPYCLEDLIEKIPTSISKKIFAWLQYFRRAFKLCIACHKNFKAAEKWPIFGPSVTTDMNVFEMNVLNTFEWYRTMIILRTKKRYCILQCLLARAVWQFVNIFIILPIVSIFLFNNHFLTVYYI